MHTRKDAYRNIQISLAASLLHLFILPLTVFFFLVTHLPFFFEVHLHLCLSLCSSVRLLSQLDETERAFDEFWVRHHTKLEQCLQLRHFEHNYREVSRRPSAELKSSEDNMIPFF